MFFCFFFFKQNTAYEMRISDWISDVCSSDLLMLLVASLLGAPLAGSAAIHALTAGAMASMILAVMTRATLGHTGRDLKASGTTVVIYALVNLGALIRVGASTGAIGYMAGMEI